MDNNIVVKKFCFQYYDEVKSFIAKYWRKDHPVILSDALFRWQYYGYGVLRGYDNFQVLFAEDKLIGFRAVIPLEIQISYKNAVKIESCLASAMWMVSPDYRGMGLGYLIHHNTEMASEASLAIGANPKTSVPLYLRGGYHEIKRFNRYIMPLNNDYSFLLFNPCDEKEIEGWIPDYQDVDDAIENNNVNELADIWSHFTSGLDIVALHRSAEYWQWRYLDSPIFKYHVFGGKDKGGIVVVRIEKVVGAQKENLTALRIVEAIPLEKNAWFSKKDETFERLLKSVIAWGQKQGCAVVDFHCTTNRLYPTFRNIGFIEQPINFQPNILSLSDFFQPIENKIHHYNGYLRLGDQEANEFFSYENSYFVRTDTDQDRVNII